MTATILVLTACGNDFVQEHRLPNKVCVLTLEAQKGRAGAGTRGLKQADETSSIEAIWSEGDRVTVLSADGSQVGTMVPLTTGSATTKLKAELHTPVSIGDNLTLMLPRTKRDYTGQKGTLADIAAKYDYATDVVTVVYADETFVSATDAKFANQQAIVKFNDKYGGKETIKDAVMASDGFFPFPDGVEVAAKAGVTAIIAPSGSLKDADVIQRANELGVALFHAPERVFSHH